MPTAAEYDALLTSNLVGDFKSYAERFVSVHSAALVDYSRRWVRNPMEHWSRLWEYPFVYEVIAGQVESDPTKRRRVLDMGSGATFFPYCLAEKLPSLELTCWDSDPILEDVFRRINGRSERSVTYRRRDIEREPDVATQFDVVYCISVIEHLRNRGAALRAFRRLLVEGGLLVVTFDISVDGDGEVPLGDAQALVDELRKEFRELPDPTHTPEPSLAMTPATLTTRHIRDRYRGLLPWKPSLRTFMRSLLRMRLSATRFDHLTIYCGAFRA